jgi:hypothetical protein
VTSFYGLTLGILGVWRVTHLLAAEDGPWDAIARMRLRLGHTVWGRLFDCFYCLSLWVAVPFAWLLGGTVTDSLLLWLGMSGGAILLERVTERREPVEPHEPREPREPYYWEDDSDGGVAEKFERRQAAGSVDYERQRAGGTGDA